MTLMINMCLLRLLSQHLSQLYLTTRKKTPSLVSTGQLKWLRLTPLQHAVSSNPSIHEFGCWPFHGICMLHDLMDVHKC